MQDDQRKRPLRKLDDPVSKGIVGLGGLALFNGVMFRGKHGLGIALQINEEKVLVRQIPKSKNTLASLLSLIPFLRGIVLIIEMTRDALYALSLSAYSVSVARKLKSNRLIKSLSVPKRLQREMMYLSFGSLLLVILIYGLLPGLIPDGEAVPTLFVFVLGILIRYFGILGYAIFLRLFPEIKTVFRYHAAEHMAIWTYQEKKPLDVEYARRFSIFHPQCGTIFLVILLIVYSVFQLILRGMIPIYLESLIILLLSLSVSYELFRYLSSHLESPWMMPVILPGKVLQRLTTKAPNDEQLDVALLALESALAIQPDQLDIKQWVVQGLHSAQQEAYHD